MDSAGMRKLAEEFLRHNPSADLNNLGSFLMDHGASRDQAHDFALEILNEFRNFQASTKQAERGEDRYPHNPDLWNDERLDVGLENCPECGHRMAGDGAYCPNCGYDAIEDQGKLRNHRGIGGIDDLDFGPQYSKARHAHNPTWSDFAHTLFTTKSGDLGQIMDALINAGASDEEASAAVDQLRSSEVDNPSVDDFRDVGPDGNLMPNDLGATPPVPDQTMGGPPTPPGAPGGGDDQPGPTDTTSSPVAQKAQDYMQQDPDMSPDELQQILVQEGYSPEEVQQAIEEMNMSSKPPMAVGAKVATPKGPGTLTHLWDAWEMRMAAVQTENGVWEGLAHQVEVLPPEKTANAADGFLERLASHYADEWYDTIERGLPMAYRDQYEQRLAAARELWWEVRGRLTHGHKPLSELAELQRHEIALDTEIEFLNDRLASDDYYVSEEERSYIESQPRYQFGRSAIGSDMGPGGSDALELAAEEALAERQSRDWTTITSTGAELFVEEQHPLLLGDATEMRRMARRHINSMTSHLPEEEARPICAQFIAQVEKARRVASRELGKSLPKQAKADNTYEGPDDALFA